MHLYSRIKETGEELYNLVIRDNVLRHGEMTVQEDVFDHETYYSIAMKSMYFSGIHICESVMKAKTQIANDFYTAGPHIRFFFYLKGRSIVEKGAGDEDYSHVIGTLQRNYLTTEGGGGIAKIDAGDETHHIIIKMSRAFYLHLLHEEPWIGDDEFHRYIIDGIPENRPNEWSYINMNMYSILHEILDSKHVTNNRYHYVKIKLRELLFCIHHETTYGKNALSSVSTAIVDVLDQIKSYLSINFVNPPTIDQLAKTYKISEKNLKKYFKVAFGTTIHAFVVRCRMEKAKVLLGDGYNVNELAVLLGYQSTSHFIQVFKTYYGETPSKMMKNIESGR